VFRDLYILQSPEESHLVRVAACASISDLLARLGISFLTKRKSYWLIQLLEYVLYPCLVLLESSAMLCEQ